MTYEMTMRKLCEYTGWDYTKSSDDRSNGADFILPNDASYRFACDGDDCAAAFAFMDLRRAGLTVRVAGAEAKRLRDGMRAFPTANQLTVVKLLNGSLAIHPSADLDLTTGYVSGGFILSATMFDVRNLRDRVRQAVEADRRVIGREYADAE